MSDTEMTEKDALYHLLAIMADTRLHQEICNITTFTDIDQNDYKGDSKSVVDEFPKMIYDVMKKIDEEKIDEIVVDHIMLSVILCTESYNDLSWEIEKQTESNDILNIDRFWVVKIKLNGREIKVYLNTCSTKNTIILLKNMSLDTYRGFVKTEDTKTCLTIPTHTKLEGYRFNNIRFI